MSYVALQDVPISVDLLTQARTTGWSTSGTVASHQNCNAGFITLRNYPVTAGHSYKITYSVLSISGGFVRAVIGGNNGISRTTTGDYLETITASADGTARFYSNANCDITGFNIQDVTNQIGTTIVYSAENDKWSDFRDYYPDFLWSLYTTTLVGFNGQLYLAQNGGNSSFNNFFGTQFQSSITFVSANQATIVSEYEAMSYQSNSLWVTDINGITTSNGQVSTLIDTDFLKQALAGSGQVYLSYQNDNVYSASFLCDQNYDTVVNGATLVGNYILITLVTTVASAFVELFSLGIRSRVVFLGSRP